MFSYVGHLATSILHYDPYPLSVSVEKDKQVISVIFFPRTIIVYA